MFMAHTKLLTFTLIETANEEKSWSLGHFCHLMFAVNANLNLSIIFQCFVKTFLSVY